MKWQDRRCRKQLPVDPFLEGLMELTKHVRVIIVSTDRRTGATTRIPQALSFAYPQAQIRMSMPRRLPVIAAGTRILAELGGKRRESVNWQTGVARKHSREWQAQIIISAHKAMIHRIRDDAGYLPEGWFVMDDAHVRNVEGELLLGLLRTGAERSTRTGVLILTDEEHASAFSDYFGKAPIYRITRPHKPVRDVTAAAELGLFGAAKMILTSFVGDQLSPGSVLLLSHGREASAVLAERIRRYLEAERLTDRMCVAEGHASVANHELEKVLKPGPHGKLRFICGTEILRAGATPPDLIGIVDSLTVRRLQSDDGIDWSVRTLPLSRDEARCTREMLTEAPGRFYLTLGRSWNDLDPDNPAADSASMTETVLELAASGAHIQDVTFLHEPDLPCTENAAEYLHLVGALDEKGACTELGRQMLEYPVDPPLARVLAAAVQRDVLPEAILAVAFLQIGGIFVGGHEPLEDGDTFSDDVIKMLYPSGKNIPPWFARMENGYRIDARKIERTRDAARQMEKTIRATFGRKSGNDCLASIHAYRAFKEKERRSPGSARLLREWCRERFLNYERIRLADALVNRMREEAEDLAPLHHQPEYDIGFSSPDLIYALLAGMPFRLARRIKEGDWQDRNGSFLLSHASCCPRNADHLFIGGTTASRLHDSKGAYQRDVRVCQFAMPVTLDQIREIHGHHLEQRRAFSVRYDPDADRVIGQDETCLFGLPLEAQSYPVDDPERAAPTIAQWLVEHPDKARQPRLVSVLNENRLWAQEHDVEEDDLYDHYLGHLKGKCRLAEVSDFSALLWPALVERASTAPVYVSMEDVRIGSRTYRLTRRGGQSTVTFDDAFIEEGAWKELPEHEWHLPNNEPLEAVVRASCLENVRLRSLDPGDLKRQIRERLNDKRIASMPLPNVPQPDWNDPQAELPPVMECTFGVDALDGTPLMAYATLGRKTNADPLESLLHPTVYRQRSVAEALRTSLQRDLPALREQWREQQALLRSYAEAHELQTRLRMWTELNGEDARIPSSWRQRAQDLSQEELAHTQSWLEAWIKRVRPFYVSLHDLTARTSVLPEVVTSLP